MGKWFTEGIFDSTKRGIMDGTVAISGQKWQELSGHTTHLTDNFRPLGLI